MGSLYKAAAATTGCSQVKRPSGPWLICERISSAGELSAPPDTTTTLGSTRMVRPPATRPTTAVARRPLHSTRSARQSA